MLKSFGQRIRCLRERKGVTLNAYAKQLGVSAGYLSNLETGKTETIPLSLLETLQKEFAIFPIASSDNEDVHLTDRFSSIQQQYQSLVPLNPEAAEYLLSSFENGIVYFLKEKK
ncbi:helix-turn-helix domain-containing protein [Bacillus sp. J33]|uniref:helix-turn-helix domain-containing protein n=1 Tax=Bacillus sp. J33 TaxID=935836 RepID=UPI00047E3F12|nr:helix-turn-helix transcriptional regulator [Bacillus sp. J33]